MAGEQNTERTIKLWNENTLYTNTGMLPLTLPQFDEHDKRPFLQNTKNNLQVYLSAPLRISGEEDVPGNGSVKTIEG